MEQTLKAQQFEVLNTAHEYTLKLVNGISMCIYNIKEGKQEEALNLLSYIVEGIEWLTEVARLTKDIQKEELKDEIMKEKLEEISSNIGSENFNKLGNFLYEEILPLLNKWENIIKDSIAS